MNSTPLPRTRGSLAPRLPAFLAMGLALVGFSACADGDDLLDVEAPAHVQVLLTDAPSDQLDSAIVSISRIYLVGRDAEEPDTVETEDDGNDAPPAGRFDLFADAENPIVVDLLTLRDGFTADLTGEVEVVPGDWAGLRFVVDSARVVLAEGYTFEDGTRSAALFVPSGRQSGIKVKIDDVLDIDPDEVFTITVDADVDQNFVIQTSGNDPNTIRRVLFTPVLRELDRAEDGG